MFLSACCPGNQQLLIRASRLGNQAVGEEWSQQLHQGNQSELSFSYRVVCMENYHGDDCSTLCRPRSDDFGHYRCDAQGRRRCLEGWEGNYCTEREFISESWKSGVSLASA